MSNRNFSNIFSPDILWGNVSSQSETGLCNLKMSECSKKAHITLLLMAMPHGSEKSPEKNRNEIRHSLCMPHGRVKIVANYEEKDT